MLLKDTANHLHIHMATPELLTLWQVDYTEYKYVK